MKKVLLVVAMLLAASQVMAGVTITAVNEGTFVTPGAPTERSATIRVDYTGDINVRAFALDINVDSGANFWGIRDFNVGENHGTNNGYGIFPGRFRQFINPQNPAWGDANGNSNYNPTPPWADPGTTNTGIGFGVMIVEMGYLGAGDANKPPMSGTLFRADINAYAFSGTATVTISADAMRGGVVDKDTNATTTAVTYVPASIVFPSPCTTPTDEVGQPKATAEGVWTTQGFTNLVGVGVVNCAQLGNIITNDQNCINLSDPLHYTYGIQSTVPNEVNVPLADANAAIIAAQLSVGTITYACANSIPAGRVISTNPAAGTSYCGAVAMVVSTGTCDCLYVGRVFDANTAGFTGLTVTQAMYDRWVAVGKPNCWCCTSQKRGNGVYTGASATKTDSIDLASVKNVANYGKNITAANACLDFNFSGKIDSVDLARVKNAANWGKVTGYGPPCR